MIEMESKKNNYTNINGLNLPPKRHIIKRDLKYPVICYFQDIYLKYKNRF